MWNETELNISRQMGLGAGQRWDLAPSRRGLLRADSPVPLGAWGGAETEGRRAPPPGARYLGDSALSAALQPEAWRSNPPGLAPALGESRYIEKKVHKGLLLYLLIMFIACLQDARHCATVETRANNLSCPCPHGS